MTFLGFKILEQLEKEERQVEKPTLEELDKARFYVTLRGELMPKETKMIGWRIDDLAGSATTIAYVISKMGESAAKRG